MFHKDTRLFREGANQFRFKVIFGKSHQSKTNGIVHLSTLAISGSEFHVYGFDTRFQFLVFACQKNRS
jgi:hypothetical protein